MHAPDRAPEPSAPPMAFLLANAGAREALWLGLALALLACLPFFVAAYPQMADYPSHLARYHIMLDGGRSEWLARYYRFEWRWSGNLGVDLLIWPMAKLFGLELGSKIAAGIIPPLTGIALVAVEWTLRRRVGVGALLALATIWSPAMLLGFTNFTLSLALALFAFAGWVRLEQWRWRWLLFMPVALAVWLCHLAGWGVLGVLVFGYEWHSRRLPAALIAPWPLALPAVPVLLGGGAAGLTVYGSNVLFYKSSILIMAMRDQLFELDTGSLLLLVMAFVFALLRGRFDGRIGRAAAIFALLAALLPRHLGGGDYTDYRLIGVALMTGCLAIDWAPPRLLLWLASALFLVRLGVTATAWHRSSDEAADMLKALEQVPRGARIAAAVAQNPRAWPNDLFQHLPSYATVRRDALVNTHFAQPGVHMLHLRQPVGDFIDPAQRILYSPGDSIDLAALPALQHADYLWYIGDPVPSRLPEGAVVLYRTPRSFLARLAKAPPAR